MNSVSLLAAAVVVAHATPRAPAAQVEAIAPGSRVRAQVTGTDPAGRVRQTERRGTLVGRLGHALVIAPDHQPVPDTVPLFAVTRLDVSRGRRARSALVLHGAAVGLVAGATVGLVLGSVPKAGDEDDFSRAIGDAFPIVFGGLGLFVGTVAGATRSPDRWARVALPRTAYDARPGRRTCTFGWRVGL